MNPRIRPAATAAPFRPETRPTRPRGPAAFSACSRAGSACHANEDRHAHIEGPGYAACFVVDGMGGHHAGAVAAELAINALCRTVRTATAALMPPDEALRLAFHRANHDVYHRSLADGAPIGRRMAATAVALLLHGGRFMVAHAGDSRAYLLRGGLLYPLTRDHTHARRLIDAGMLRPERAAEHPHAALLERAVGHRAQLHAEFSTWAALQPDDVFLLCSDGLSAHLPDDEIRKLLLPGTRQQAEALILGARAAGSTDDVTVQIVHIEGPHALPRRNLALAPWPVLAGIWARQARRRLAQAAAQAWQRLAGRPRRPR